MNKNGKPVYGAYMIVKDWYFMVNKGKKHCMSESYSDTNKQELLQMIALLREFRLILAATLIDFKKSIPNKTASPETSEAVQEINILY